MSTPPAVGPIGEAPIVVHAPLSGDPHRILGLPEEVREIRNLHAPRDLPTLPPGVGEPRSRAAAALGHVNAPARVHGLDVVRGVSLLAMNFTFALPPNMLLPAWMYHMQSPPPSGAYAALSGLTWQDAIFPGFLFAMAAAVPIRGAQLFAAGEPVPAFLWSALKRTAMLYVFSLIIGHTNPSETGDATKRGNLVAMAGFLTCFAIFVRARSDWNPRAMAWVRRAGWLAAALLLFVVPVVGWGGEFSLLRRDSIITSIAFVYLLSSIIWVFTRGRALIRVGIMLVIALMIVLAPVVTPVAGLWGRVEVPWLFEAWFIELMLIALPGTIAGDLLARLMQLRLGTEAGEPRRHLGVVAVIGLLVPVVLVVGLYQRQVMATTVALLGLVAVGWYFLSRPQSERDRVLARMGALAGVLLVIGILVEPLQGGIKKNPQTLSYLLLSAGLWLSVLLSATVLLDVLQGAFRRALRPVALAGQNAMLAYVVFMLFFLHIAYYAGFGDMLSATVPQQVLRGALVTSLVLGTLWTASRFRIVWRS